MVRKELLSSNVAYTQGDSPRHASLHVTIYYKDKYIRKK